MLLLLLLQMIWLNDNNIGNNNKKLHELVHSAYFHVARGVTVNCAHAQYYGNHVCLLEVTSTQFRSAWLSMLFAVWCAIRGIESRTPEPSQRDGHKTLQNLRCPRYATERCPQTKRSPHSKRKKKFAGRWKSVKHYCMILDASVFSLDHCTIALTAANTSISCQLKKKTT